MALCSPAPIPEASNVRGEERRVAYQGAPGAFSEEAALRFAEGFVPTAYATFAEVFAAVTHGACARACTPLRNSLAGPVPEVCALLSGSGLRVASEHDLPIRLHLLAAPGATLDTVRSASSHLMALKQCAAKLRALGLSPVEVFDTAGAARDVAATADPARAAVASRRAAELYGLRVLMADIQDAMDNHTRFAVLWR